MLVGLFSITSIDPDLTPKINKVIYKEETIPKYSSKTTKNSNKTQQQPKNNKNYQITNSEDFEKEEKRAQKLKIDYNEGYEQHLHEEDLRQREELTKNIRKMEVVTISEDKQKQSHLNKYTKRNKNINKQDLKHRNYDNPMKNQELTKSLQYKNQIHSSKSEFSREVRSSKAKVLKSQQHMNVFSLKKYNQTEENEDNIDRREGDHTDISYNRQRDVTPKSKNTVVFEEHQEIK